MKRELIPVQAGQIWQDRDRRMMCGHRRVRVSHVAPGITEGVGFFPQWVFYVAVGLDNRQPVVEGCVGPTYRSRYERFQRAFDFLEGA